jgi:hypothetical protein
MHPVPLPVPYGKREAVDRRESVVREQPFVLSVRFPQRGVFRSFHAQQFKPSSKKYTRDGIGKLFLFRASFSC